MHNYLTLSYLNDINELYDVMAMIKTYKYPKHVTKKNEEKHNLCDDYHLYILMVDEDITLEDWEEMTDQCLRKWWQ